MEATWAAVPLEATAELQASDAMRLRRTITAVVQRGENTGYIAECLELPVVTQARSLDELMQNLKEAVELHLDGEDLAAHGLAPHPTLRLTYTVEMEQV